MQIVKMRKLVVIIIREDHISVLKRLLHLESWSI